MDNIQHHSDAILLAYAIWKDNHLFKIKYICLDKHRKRSLEFRIVLLIIL